MKKLISLVSIFLICLSVLVPFRLFADEPETGLYYWIERGIYVNTSNGISSSYRFLSNSNRWKLFLCRDEKGDNDKLYGYVYVNFDTTDERTSFLSEHPLYLNYVQNGLMASQSSQLSMTSTTSYSYKNISAQSITNYCAFYRFEINKYFYNSNLVDTYIYFEEGGSSNMDSPTNIVRLICYIEHGVDTGTNNFSNLISKIEMNRSYPFVFAPANTGGDQRTHDPDNEPYSIVTVTPELFTEPFPPLSPLSLSELS